MSTAFVLGNGRSRLAVDPDTLNRFGDVYGCNALYREFTPRVLVATDRPIAEAIQHSGYSRRNIFYTRRPLEGMGARRIPQDWFGFSSGPAAVAIAAQQGAVRVYMLGFDLGPLPGELFNNVYADTEFYKRSSARPTFTGNWIRQIQQIARQFGRVDFVRVHGDTTAYVDQFDSIANLRRMSMEDFLGRINTQKDI
jgi:hypothetical protein